MPWYDWLLILASIAAVGYPLWDFEEFIYRAAIPNELDQIFGGSRFSWFWKRPGAPPVGSCRRSPLVFLAYAVFGAYLPPPWTHQGYGLDRLVGHMYVTLEGIFGVPLDVAATFIILFTIYGAVLEFSKAGRVLRQFFLAATGGKPAAAGRTVTLASFLLGGPRVPAWRPQ